MLNLLKWQRRRGNSPILEILFFDAKIWTTSKPREWGIHHSVNIRRWIYAKVSFSDFLVKTECSRLMSSFLYGIEKPYGDRRTYLAMHSLLSNDQIRWTQYRVIQTRLNSLCCLTDDNNIKMFFIIMSSTLTGFFAVFFHFLLVGENVNFFFPSSSPAPTRS